jgi:hypothetical protein
MKHTDNRQGGKWFGTTIRAVSGFALVTILAGGLQAQTQNNTQEEFDELRRNVDIFTGMLKEGLGFNVRQQVFMPRGGDVRGRYLAGQGITLEITTPLQSARAAIGMQSMQDSLQDLSVQLSSLMERGLVMRPDFESLRESMALSLRSEEIATFYREQMQRLSSIEDFTVVDRALSAASASVRNLQNLGELDAATTERMSEELRELRGELVARVSEMNELRREMRERSQASDELPDDQTRQRWQQASEQLQAQAAELREQAMTQTQALRERNEQLRAQRVVQWQQEVTDFENQVFRLLCEFAGGLRSLPDGENVTAILSGLGEDAGTASRRDRIHVISREDLQLCQRGDIDFAQLRQRAVSYTF